ncbi:GspE/PulE family protein [Thauera sinica]|uniref:GspE/PulE family protein n=1 Tax=Thauera sinica TaxID=2665146 RepID=A0ABW1AY58_9RHOO|nr:GspE/PulE family protein [Thauera sp. K11]ATE58680.1 secretion system protein E [Thauera sp. K11]
MNIPHLPPLAFAPAEAPAITEPAAADPRQDAPAGDAAPRPDGGIGEQLRAAGLIGSDQLRIALHEQRRQHRPLGRLLVELGFVQESALRDVLAARVGRPCVDLATTLPAADALALLPHEAARRHRLLPLHFDAAGRVLTVALADADDIVAIDRLRGHLAADVRLDLRVAGESELVQAIEHHYGQAGSVDDILREMDGEPGHATPLASTPAGRGVPPVVRLVDALIADAVAQGASDVHFEPEAGFLRIRYRIDGLLHQVRALHRSRWPEMAVRLKVMAGLDIAETRAPQDGRITLGVGGRPIDLRIATQPTLHGENIVLRILDRQKGIVPLHALGLAEDQRATLERMMARPEGLILVTGPTGSGKTTTLYSVLNHLNTEAVNIMTLEDPVEYPLPLIRQTAVGEASRLNFAGGVRALLRQDPDIILVGEIRDADTAEMAIRAALTGHQVYATLHAGSAVSAIPRLMDIGIRPELLAGNLIGILAQRLVRRLCPLCREAHAAGPDERRKLGLPVAGPEVMIHRPAGCAACDFRGYRGRSAIMELLCIDPALDELVARRAGPQALLAQARDGGFLTLAEDGARRVLDGTTSLQELARVVALATPAA